MAGAAVIVAFHTEFIRHCVRDVDMVTLRRGLLLTENRLQRCKAMFVPSPGSWRRKDRAIACASFVRTRGFMAGLASHLPLEVGGHHGRRLRIPVAAGAGPEARPAALPPPSTTHEGGLSPPRYLRSKGSWTTLTRARRHSLLQRAASGLPRRGFELRRY